MTGAAAAKMMLTALGYRTPTCEGLTGAELGSTQTPRSRPTAPGLYAGVHRSDISDNGMTRDDTWLS